MGNGGPNGLTFYRRGANQHRIEGESTLVTVLNLVDKDTGWPLSTQVQRKGRESSA